MIEQARKEVEEKSRASILLDQAGVKLKEDDSVVQLKFYSLDSRATIYTIPNADSLLDFDSVTGKLWVLRV